MHIGLYFGSFNPIHYGHLMIASYMLNFHDFEEIWFILTPTNPFKINEQLADEQMRLKMIELAIEHAGCFKVLDIEFQLAKPSYTVNTLAVLERIYQKHTFSMIMGYDNLINFPKWNLYEEILKKYKIYVYPRQSSKKLNNPWFKDVKSVIVTKAPIISISSSFIRRSICEGKKLQYFTTNRVLDFIQNNALYGYDFS